MATGGREGANPEMGVNLLSELIVMTADDARALLRLVPSRPCVPAGPAEWAAWEAAWKLREAVRRLDDQAASSPSSSSSSG